MVLPDCVLFPHGTLPLRIFEPRYREMLNDSLEGDFVFGIVNRIDTDADEDYARSAARVGTAGLVRACKKAEDDTSELILHGLQRIRIESWESDSNYPKARISILENEPKDDNNSQLNNETKKALALVHEILEGADLQAKAVFEELLVQTSNPNTLADLIAHYFVHTPAERQQLLETLCPSERIKRITHFLQDQK